MPNWSLYCCWICWSELFGLVQSAIELRNQTLSPTLRQRAFYSPLDPLGFAVSQLSEIRFVHFNLGCQIPPDLLLDSESERYLRFRQFWHSRPSIRLPHSDHRSRRSADSTQSVRNCSPRSFRLEQQ